MNRPNTQPQSVSKPAKPGFKRVMRRGLQRGLHRARGQLDAPLGLHLRRRLQRRLGPRGRTAGKGVINGVDWLLRNPEDVVGQTPWHAVLQHNKLTVRRYGRTDAVATTTGGHAQQHHKQAEQRPRLPVLLIPPLMVKPYIFDLVEQRSFVRHLLDAGFDTYLVDFGEPDHNDTGVSLDDYVLDWMPMAVDAVCASAGTDQLFLTGYCMGGLFALMHTAANEDKRVAGIVTIGSPIDSHKMGVLSFASRRLRRPVEFISERLGNVPGELSSRLFKLMSPTKQVTRYIDLLLHLYDDDYVRSFDALSAWTDNFIDYPQDAFRQLFVTFMVENRLKDGRFVVGTDRPGGAKVADLARITMPVLAFAGQSDTVVREGAVREITTAVGTADVTVVVAPGGHMGVFAGRHAPDAVWAPAAQWMLRCEQRAVGLK